MTQKEAMEYFLPMIEKNGSVYRKIGKVYARPAVKGEKIDTYTSDGKETTNTAKEGDIVVKNQTGSREKYILSKDKFEARYKLIGEASEKGWKVYEPTGKILAINFDSESLNKPNEMDFEASWGEKMKLKDGDMVATPLPKKDEIYRIASKEFSETYDIGDN